MTLAEKFKEEGKEEGIAKGKAEGKAEGRLETLQQTLVKMIRKRFGEDTVLIKGVQSTREITVLEDLIDTFLESSDRDILKAKLQS